MQRGVYIFEDSIIELKTFFYQKVNQIFKKRRDKAGKKNNFFCFKQTSFKARITKKRGINIVFQNLNHNQSQSKKNKRGRCVKMQK
ncbi:hypothetical protein BpHYR1_034449 [Brachionus plicatilis]|uniref:Uncharacterized protein n=1 Tax=Brachionus plicatilis TaxID=10195 RepID=A0A3M7SCC4_BRAPC|nr:hypothetical protein BpHYR1_034449 [Brachionus plicatilis]